MKLLFFIHALSGGGAERVTTNLANHWADRGWDVTIVTLAPERLDAYPLHSNVHRISLNLAIDSANTFAGLANNLQRVFSLNRVIQKCRPDIAIGMMATTNVLLALASLGLRTVKVVVSERTHPPSYPLGKIWEILRRYSYGHVAGVVALTQKSASWLREHTQARRILVIPNAATLPLPRHLPLVDPSKFCHLGRHIVLAVGRLAPEKGMDTLIDAFSYVAQEHSEWDLVILGEGPDSDDLREQVVSHKLGSRVTFVGRVGNVGDWYRHADIFVLSSRFEGFPNALIEAMSYGVCSVSFDCDTGPSDIIRHEVDGLLVAPGDTHQLSVAMDRLMRDFNLRQQLASKAVEVLDKYSFVQVIKRWEMLFEEIN